ncbi:hypothetical protein L21SP3_00035 [Sedimentisphaera cyanobacteriorum]|uniref:DUF4340 domain-containing protein n=1 Tax=Sedimentisphaera cyanobacteriorum TaxID=1940790 RepID=A0A1Q2HKZ7_9BACT|nr:DUF4340 domain-containing protein [Sedimentisphaera cyanobacteriorum]AQQ08259.1 hypothetical protein L21SP3_00035 [Sedimentisphaera cyanobacteriorum]
MVMTDKKLSILAAAALAAVVLVTAQSMFTGEKTRYDSGRITYLIQGLDMDMVSGISIKGSSGEPVSIIKEGGEYYLESMSGYPVKVSKLNELISKCLDVKIGKVYTTNPSNFEDLEVTKDQARYNIQFLASDGKVLTGLIVGKNKGSGNYVRKFADNNVYISEESFFASTSANSYVERSIVKVEGTDVEKVSVKTPEGSYEISNENGNRKLKGIPEGMQAKGTDFHSVLDALGRVNFTDAAKASEMTELNFEYQYVSRLNDSTVYTFEVAKKGQDYWAKCSAEFTNKEKVIKKDEVESEEELKKKEDILLKREAAANFNDRHEGWVYKIPSWNAKNLTKHFNDLIEKVPEEKPEQEAEGSDAQAAEKAASEKKTQESSDESAENADESESANSSQNKADEQKQSESEPKEKQQPKQAGSDNQSAEEPEKSSY